MSAMSELHGDLETIHNILLGQRKVAVDAIAAKRPARVLPYHELDRLERKVEVIDDLLLEFEAAGIVWPGNVVELPVDYAWCDGVED